jgi:hypothetical protein
MTTGELHVNFDETAVGENVNVANIPTSSYNRHEHIPVCTCRESVTSHDQDRFE